MKSFQTALTWGMAAAIAAAAGCTPTARDFGGQGSANTSGGNVGGAGGAGSSAVAVSAAGQGGGTPSGSGTTTGSLSGSTGSSNMTCVTASGCDDSNFCTKDICTSSGVCLNAVNDNCCPHSICTVGPALNNACLFMEQPIDCATVVCKTSPSCCSTAWTKECVEAARNLCSDAMGGASCMCSHSYCKEGESLDANCDPCVHSICKVRPSCCAAGSKWDADCVTQTNQECNIPLGANCQ